MATDISDIIKTILKRSLDISAPPAITNIEKTMEEAPLSPAHDTSRHCLIEHLNGRRIANTATGLATNVRNTAIAMDVGIIDGNICGYDNNPSIKNITICASVVTPSKKGTMFPLFLIRLFPRSMPKRYIHKKPLPPTYCDNPRPSSTTASINMVSRPLAITSVLVSTYIATTASTTPISVPYTSCANMAYGTEDRLSPLSIDIPITVSIYATGSLLPLSISRSDATPSLRLSFLRLNIAKTLAASVADITAPTRKLSANGNFNT